MNKELNTDTNTSSEERYLEFSLGNENYAVPLLDVKEVIAVPDTTPIPHAPSHFVGIMNLRGQVISIVDLRKKMKISPKEQSEEVAVVILEVQEITLGVIVDQVNRVLGIREDQISEAPQIEGKNNHDYMLGIYRGENTMTVLMNVFKILGIEELNFVEKQAA
ncbi:MAG: purine-binding chemotaxis protein CheW [Bdellovibrionaceae bacterium]|jgi:purine-binding chemotaxis protein CheW|nr:purine-binding chemotaxis protein CheW [Pseudobdellovibrionaceae bacterium]